MGDEFHYTKLAFNLWYNSIILNGIGGTPFIEDVELNLCRPCFLRYKGSLKTKGSGAQATTITIDWSNERVT